MHVRCFAEYLAHKSNEMLTVVSSIDIDIAISTLLSKYFLQQTFPSHPCSLRWYARL